jgi:hypothetical protein
MGYDTYNAFNSNFTGALATEQARLMHKYGLVAAGYKVLVINSLRSDGQTKSKARLLSLMISTRKSTDHRRES